MVIRRQRKPRLVRVHFRDVNESVEGVLLGTDAGHYRLANARRLIAEEQSQPLAGEQWYPRERVLFVQVLG